MAGMDVYSFDGIVGVKNRILVNWLWNYFTFDQSLYHTTKNHKAKKRRVKDSSIFLLIFANKFKL